MQHDSEIQRRLIRRTSLGDETAFAELFDKLIFQTAFACLCQHCTPARTDEVLYKVWMDVWKEATQISTNRASVACQLALRVEDAILNHPSSVVALESGVF